jgi:RNA polymerase sigma-70 factor (ECF subfamily)
MVMAFDAAGAQSDAALIRRFAAGDPGAARLLSERLTPLAFRIAFRMLGDRTEAEDVAQDTMLRLWRTAPGWREGEAQVSTWVCRVAMNLSTDRLRRRRTEPLDGLPEPAEDRPGAVQGLIAADRARAFEAALARLPERQRQAVILRHIEGLANPEIAAIMDVGVEAVESLSARGRRALAAMLAGRREDLGYDDDD